MKTYLLTAIILFSIIPPLSAQNIRINEFMASNSSTIKDPDYNEFSDWIELFNAGNDTAILKDCYITDDISNPRKYRITNPITVAPGKFLIIWADDRNSGLHANFKLSASGEAVAFSSTTGQIIDSVTFGAQQTDISYGRNPDGFGGWFLMQPSTPGLSNPPSSIFNKLDLPLAHPEGGFFSGAQQVTLSHSSPGAKIRYRRDGKIPSETDSLYINPIRFDSTGIIRVRAFKEGFLPSITLSQSYFINEPTTLPVFSLCSDPNGFFSDTSGIYVAGTNGITGNCSTTPKNWNQDWEREADIQLFESDRTKGFSTTAGVKIFGGCSRIYAMKSLAFYFRSEYGFDKLNYRLFPQLRLTEYNNFLLRSSSQDWWRTMFRDALVHMIISRGTKLDVMAYRPSVLFINGTYWGIHNIREKINEHYLGYHHPINKDNIDLVEISKAVSANNGDTIAYNSMINFLSTHSMSNSTNYEYIKSIIDIDNYIDYQIMEIYSANGDWPGSNMKLWRERTVEGKFRWIIYDMDFTFGGNGQGMATTNTLEQATATNGPSWPNPPWATLVLRKLLENYDFKYEFIQRFAIHMNTTFDKKPIHNLIDSIKSIIASDIPRHKAKWPQSISLGSDWNVNIQVMKDFATNRPANVKSHFCQKFGLSGTYSLFINTNNPEWGKIYAHTVELNQRDSAYILFNSIPLKVTAKANPGYRFVCWEGVSNSESSSITMVLSSGGSLKAVFEPVQLTVKSPVLNEINYKSSALFDTDDWIEIYNPSDSAISFRNWTIRGNNSGTVYTFPDNLVLSGKSYLIASRDTGKFRNLHNTGILLTGNLPFGLSSDNETITLQNAESEIIDEVHYYSSNGWPTQANGTGSTLSLIDPQKDNSLSENWKASAWYGTPGRLNDTYTKVTSKTPYLAASHQLLNNYPNPFNPETEIVFIVGNSHKNGLSDHKVSIRIYDLLGRLITTLINTSKTSGTYSTKWNASNQTSAGIYLIEFACDDFHQTRKIILMK